MENAVTVSIDGVERVGRSSWPRQPLAIVVDIACPRCGKAPLVVRGQGAAARVGVPGYFISFEPAAVCCNARFDFIKATFEPSPLAEKGVRR